LKRTRHRLKNCFLLLLLMSPVLLAFSCSGQGGSDNDTADTPGEQAQAGDAGERVLRVYSALDPKESKIYFSEYMEKTGVRIQWVRMSSGAVLARVKVERNNPSMGLWFGGSSTDFISAAGEDLLASYRPDINFDLPPQAHDPDWKWTGFYFGAIGFASNRERLERIGADPPRSWQDLLKPEFKNEIGMAYPYTSGTAYTALSTLLQLMGVDKGFDYVARMDENIHHYNKSGSACVTQVGLGEIGVGIAFSHDIMKKGVSKFGDDVILSFPEEGTGYEIGAMALIKGGKDREEAEKFMDWIMSVEAQGLMQRWYRIPLNPDAEVAEGAVKAEDLNLIEDDAVWAGENKEKFVNRWRLITAR